MDEKGVGEGVIAPKVWESCMAKESVLSSDRVSKVDYWISYIAQYYDINFPETYEIMREHDLCEKGSWTGFLMHCRKHRKRWIFWQQRWGNIWMREFETKNKNCEKQ